MRLPMAFPAEPIDTIAPVRLLTLAVPGGNMYVLKAVCARVVAMRPRWSELVGSLIAPRGDDLPKSIPTTAPPIEMVKTYARSLAVAFILRS